MRTPGAVSCALGLPPTVRRPALALMIVFLLPWAAGAQDGPFLPLAAGNAWTYVTPLDPPDAPPDTVWNRRSAVTGTATVDDTLYFVVVYPFAPADTLRPDEEGRIWARSGGEDVLLFDFTRADGEAYAVRLPGRLPSSYEVTVTRHQAAEVAGGRFDGCIRLTFDDPATMDDGFAFTFAPGVGIVTAYGDGGSYRELYAAEIDGRVVTAVEAEDAVPRRPHPAYAYPNPFRHAATIVLPMAGRRPGRARVYDARGRAVATLKAAECSAGRCVFEWDGTGFASGTYFVTTESDGFGRAVRIVRSR